LAALVLGGCSRPVFHSKWARQKAPSTYTVRFETSKGLFDVQVNRLWSPKAADRFYQLVKHHYFDSALFYRVVPNFVAQFGSADSVRMHKWSRYKIPDEDAVHSNIKGAISFARSGKETRGTDLYINLKDNLRLDTLLVEGVKGYPAFGDVVRGMDVVSALYSGYGNKTMELYDTLYKNPVLFHKTFPQLDVVRKAYLVKN